MPAKGKRKNNPGKNDRVHPPHKTRLPVTDHPQSLNPTNGGIVSVPATECLPVTEHPPTLPLVQPMDDCMSRGDGYDSDTSMATGQQEVPPSTASSPPAPHGMKIMLIRGLFKLFPIDKGWNAAGEWLYHLDELAKICGTSLAEIEGNLELDTPIQHTRDRLFPKPLAKIEVTTQTTPLPSTPTSDKSTTHAGTQTSAAPATVIPEDRQASSCQTTSPPATATPRKRQEVHRQAPSPQIPPRQTRAVVLHAAPSKYKPGLMRRWIEEDNDTQILGIRWLLGEQRRIGKLASSLVIYLAHSIDISCGTLRMGRRRFRISEYDWDRPSEEKGKGH